MSIIGSDTRAFFTVVSGIEKFSANLLAEAISGELTGPLKVMASSTDLRTDQADAGLPT